MGTIPHLRFHSYNRLLLAERYIAPVYPRLGTGILGSFCSAALST